MNIIRFDKLDSTNTYAKQNIDMLEDKTVVSAAVQTNGYGRFTRSWVDLGTENIYMTFVLKPSEVLSDKHANLTQYLSVTLCKQLEELGLSPQIKWPNDVLLNGKKVCGILAETVIKGGKLKGIALGIGVNLNASAQSLLEIDRPATSMNIELGHDIDKQKFMQELVENFFENYDEFLENGFIYIKKDYEKRATFNKCQKQASHSPSPPEGEGRGGGQKKITHLYSKKALDYAKELRKNMTDAENSLWYYLRKRQMDGVKFRKQSPIGCYIVDFVCFEKKLVIELDGGQHLDNTNVKHDKKRDDFLSKSGYTVLRIFNTEIFENIEGVLGYVYSYVAAPHPNPPPQVWRENAINPSLASIKVAVFDKVKEGEFVGFGDDGTLLLRTFEGKIENVNMGELI